MTRIVLLFLICTGLAGCVTTVDEQLPRQQLPHITLAADVRLVASPSHATAYLPSNPIPAGTELPVIATDRNAAWLLVLHDDILGWIPTIFSRTNIATIEPAFVVDPLADACTDFLGGTLSLAEKWGSSINGSAIVLGTLYSNQSASAFADASLQLIVEGQGRATAADYIHTALTPSSAIVLFAFSVADLQQGDLLHFAFANGGGERVAFEAMVFSDSCEEEWAHAGNGLADTLLIGQATNSAESLAPQDNPVSLLPTVTPTAVATRPTPTPAATKRSAAASPTPTRVKATPTPRVISVTSGPSSSQGVGLVNSELLNVRAGPDTSYPIITQLEEGTRVAILGSDPGGVWWQIELPGEASGWVHSDFIEITGCRRCIPVVTPPPTLQPVDTPLPAPPSATLVASNRTDFNGTQAVAGWKYLQESARNSGQWMEMSFDGSCYRATSWEHDVRICAEGEVHPGQSTRIAYEWRPNFHGNINLTVHAHKIDTTCGDGIWVGVYRARDGVGFEQELGTFQTSGRDNQGVTRTYASGADPGNLFYFVVDIRGDSTCDLTRLFIDIAQN